MRNFWVGCLTVLLSLSLSAPAFGAVYRWVDEQGRVHFTDDLSKVPKGGRMEEVNVPNTPMSVFPSNAPAAASKPEEGDQEGALSGGQNWESLLKAVRGEIQERQAAREKLEAELQRPKYKQMVRSERLLRQELELLNQEIDQLKAREKEIQRGAERSGSGEIEEGEGPSGPPEEGAGTGE